MAESELSNLPVRSANFTKIVLVIPSLEPDEKLVNFLKAFTERQKIVGENSHITDIILINDGSSAEYDPIFEKCVSEFGCIFLKHAYNLGKGRALKTAINYYLNNFPRHDGILTADADGQHGVDDIFRCAEQFNKTPDRLILGSRNFNQEDVPFKSRCGNKITRQVFRALSGVYVSDTQTGLRVIPQKFMKALLSLKGERFEYELNMLIEARENDILIDEVLIETIYIEENRSSHFRPLTDSARVYSVFLKFIISSLSSFFIDIALFTLLNFLIVFSAPKFLYSVAVATVIARIASSLFNYAVNKKVVFKNNSGKETLAKYYLLALCQMLLSASAVQLIELSSLLSAHVTFIKIIVDSLLFIISFPIQRRWVFKKQNLKKLS